MIKGTTLQAMIDDCGPGKYNLPSGDFYIDTPLVIPPGVHLVGAGRAVSRIIAQTSTSPIVFEGSSDQVPGGGISDCFVLCERPVSSILCRNTRQLIVTNLAIRGGTPTNRIATAGIRFEGKQRIGSAFNLVSHVLCQNVAGSAFECDGDTARWTNRSHFHDCTAQSCNVGFYFLGANTHAGTLNTQGCEIGLHLDSSKHNRFGWISENDNVTLKLSRDAVKNKFSGSWDKAKQDFSGGTSGVFTRNIFQNLNDL